MVRGQRVALLLEGLVPRHQPDAEFRCVNDGLETNTVDSMEEGKKKISSKSSKTFYTGLICVIK